MLFVFRKYLMLWVILAVCPVLLQGCHAPLETYPSQEGLSTYPIEINLPGTKNTFLLDSQGRLKTNVEITSADGAISLSIDKDTILLDKDGEPLQLIQATIDPNPPPPPEDAYIIGAVYVLLPQGATFNPSLKLTLGYDPGELPQGVREGDVYIAYYEDSKWNMIRYRQVDTEKHKVATQVDYFARYAVLTPKKESTPTPAPEPGLTSISLDQALSTGKPTLAEFGSSTCQPCKAMKPILEELTVEYKDKLNVVIVEVNEYRELTSQYGIMVIPTQILFDSSGQEIMRHIGFWAREDIIIQLQKIGIE